MRLGNAHASLLALTDPAPVELVNADMATPLLLLCEHAGNDVPAALGDLGVGQEILASHRGWDIGAERVARRLADMLKAPLIIQRYSRLVIDCNRPPSSPLAMPRVSDRVTIPSNCHLTATDKAARVAEIFQPLEQAITAGFATHKRKAAFSIHSFTPRLGGVDRPWHAGFLTRKSQATAEHLKSSLATRMPELNLALNQPYQIDDETDWFIPHHAEARGLPHCLIEIRNDQIGTNEACLHWASMLADAIRTLPEILP